MPTNVQTSKPYQPQAIPPLTSLRGLAALAVLFYHVQVTFPDRDLIFFDLFKNGGLGVDLFFVLSGFIMAHVYTEVPILVKSRSFIWSFIKARLARIYPLHFVTLIATLALVMWLPGFAERYKNSFGLDAFALNLFLMQSWGFIGWSWNGVSWSISAEWFMYLLFPFLLMGKHVFFSAQKWRIGIFSLLALTTLFAHYAFIYLRNLDHYGGMSAGGMIRVFFEFSLGFFTYHIRDVLRPKGRSAFEGYVFVLSAFVIYVFIYKQYWPLFVPFVALLISGLSHNQGAVAKTLRSRSLVYLGEISFSVYMWHWLVIQVHNLLRAQGTLSVQSPTQLYLHCFSMVIISLLIGAISFGLIERPARAWIRRTG